MDEYKHSQYSLLQKHGLQQGSKDRLVARLVALWEV